jgi:serine-type anaerobic sulfatase-maturating enzyme
VPLSDRDVRQSLVQGLEGFAATLTVRERAALLAILRQSPAEPALAELAAAPPATVLRPEERQIFEHVSGLPAPRHRPLAPHLTLILKVTQACNLRCTYCRSWAAGPGNRMSFEVLAHAIRGALAAPEARSVEFIWHGGEPTLRSPSFFSKALWLQQQWRQPGQRIINNLQTNGTRLDAEWAGFLRRYGFRVGVSLDGPPEIHDRRRRDRAGNPTSERVRAGLATLRDHGFARAICLVVDDEIVAAGPQRLLDCLLEAGVQWAGLLAVVPQGGPHQASPDDPYLDFGRYVDFQRQLFRLWWPDFVERITFREINALLRRLQGRSSGYCVFESGCMGTAMTVDAQGDLWACDNFQGDPAFRFGNILQAPLFDALGAAELVRARSAAASAADHRRGCEWFDICHGGCPYDREIRRIQSIPGDDACCGWAPLIAEIAAAAGHPVLHQPLEATGVASLNRKEPPNA